MTRIPIHRKDGTVRAYALVDAEDYARLSPFVWRLAARSYAGRWTRDAEGKRRMIYMHRAVTGIADDDPRWVDHINRRPLDNRRSNLRILHRSLSLHNSTPRCTSSRFRGVGWHQHTQRWRARGHVNGVEHYLGLFASEEAAGEAARAWRLAHMEAAVD